MRQIGKQNFYGDFSGVTDVTYAVNGRVPRCECWPDTHLRHRVSLFSSVDSSVEIMTRLQTGWPRNTGSSLGRRKINYCPIKTLGSVLGSTDSHTQRIPRALSPEVKRPDHNHSPPSNIMIKSEWSYTYTTPCVFILCVRGSSIYRKIL